MCLNHNKSAKAYRDTRVRLNLTVTSEDVYREIMQEYLNRESLSTDCLLTIYFLIELVYSFSHINLFILHAC